MDSRENERNGKTSQRKKLDGGNSNTEVRAVERRVSRTLVIPGDDCYKKEIWGRGGGRGGGRHELDLIRQKKQNSGE